MSIFGFSWLPNPHEESFSGHHVVLLPYILYKRNSYYLVKYDHKQLEFVDAVAVDNIREFDTMGWILKSINRLVQILRPDCLTKVIHVEYSVLSDIEFQPGKFVRTILFDWDIIEDAFDVFALNSEIFQKSEFSLRWICLKDINDPSRSSKYRNQAPFELLTNSNFQSEALHITLRSHHSNGGEESMNDKNFERSAGAIEHAVQDLTKELNGLNTSSPSSPSSPSEIVSSQINSQSVEISNSDERGDSAICSSGNETHSSSDFVEDESHVLETESPTSSGSNPTRTGRRIPNPHNGSLRVPKSSTTLSKEFYDQFA